MEKYLLRIGNGNDGEYPNCIIEIGENDSVFDFAKCAMANFFVVGHKARSHAYKETVVGGDDETIFATLHESFRGETEMGAAYKTMRLEKMDSHMLDWYSDLNMCEIKDYLDRGALIKYKQMRKSA